jgi:alkylation response protein AidB-like acyl-CoA dehydrogenase
MDFEPTETQRAVATAIPEPQTPTAQTPTALTPTALTWKELGTAGLLALPIPDWLGGEGLGILEIATLSTEIGRCAAHIPSLMTGVLPVVRHADRDTQRALLTGAAEGDTQLTAALREPAARGEPADPLPASPSTVTNGATVTGVKVGVPYTERARHIILAATLIPDGTTLLVAVSPSAPGVALEPTHTASGVPEHTLRLDSAPVAHVIGGPEAVADLYRLAIASACCVADGAVAGALALTTEHVRTREQFGRPLATFQAVAQQIADVAIMSRTLHLATVSACWRLAVFQSDGVLDPDADLAVAPYWLTSRAPTALRTCHHLHGGTGMDVTYPLHRYSTLVRDLVRTLGGTDYWIDHVH